jgi:hypothetical protein
MFQQPKGESTSATEIMAGYIREATLYLSSAKKPAKKNRQQATQF